MLGTIVNSIAIILGAGIGICAGKILPQKITTAVMEAMGLATVFIGIQGALKGEKAIVLIISIVFGTVVGTFIDIDKYINMLGEFLRKNIAGRAKNFDEKFVNGFVNASVLFGVGAMAIMGSIEAGIKHDYNILFLKSTMDFVSAVMLSASMGVGVMFSAIIIFVLQGSMTIFASLLKILVENEEMLNEISCVGNILIIAIGLNIMGVTKLKVANMVPAIILSPLIYFIIVDVICI